MVNRLFSAFEMCVSSLAHLEKLDQFFSGDYFSIPFNESIFWRGILEADNVGLRMQVG